MDEDVSPANIYVERKGGKVLLREGYEYYKVREYKNGNAYWRCSNKKKKRCSGSVTISQKEKIVKHSVHSENCCANIIGNTISMSMDNLKKQVQVSDEPIPKLYNETLAKYKNSTYDILTAFPSYSNVKHGLYNTRNLSLGISKTVFKNLEEVEVPLKFVDFLLADYNFEGTRVIVFCSLRARNMMGQLKEFFVDGTFRCCPAPFIQLLSIFGENGSTSETTTVVPLLYALLSDKKQSTYFAIFDILRSQLKWDPRKIHCDFEISLLNSIKQFCTTITIVGCYYHWSQCIWRKAKSLGLSKTKSKKDKRIVSLCSVLPLLPAEKILEGWNYIKYEINDGSNKLIEYIEHYWIKKDFVNFSQLVSVFNERHRTNNVLEGSHAKLSRCINAKNKTLLRLLNVLEKFSTLSICDQTRRKRRKIQIENDDYIREIQLQMITGEITIGHALEKLR